MSKRWLITGVSSGFGLELATAALDRGDSVVGTLRNAAQIAAFEGLAPGRATAVILDVTDTAVIPAAVEAALAALGGLDVLVNNAGYGLFGTIEELDDPEIRHCIETNFFGSLNVTKAALPALRAHGGRILNISSQAGICGIPGGGAYNAAKFAVEGLSEALAAELAPFGIKVTIVEPGGFRTDFAKGSQRRAARTMPEYAGTPGAQIPAFMANYAGREPGDPAKAAQALLTIADADAPPLRFVLGAGANKAVAAKIAQVAEDIATWRDLSRGDSTLMFAASPVDTRRLTSRAHALAFPDLPEALRATEARLTVGARERWAFDPHALLEAATARTSLADFGPAYFREALDRLCRSAESDLELSAIGRRNLHCQILDHLVQRLRFEDLWNRRPEILEEPLEAPIVIVGLPRSGTTFLQQLLSLDPVIRSAPFWESLSPLPDHDPTMRPPDDAPLIARAAGNVAGLAANAPGLLALHQLDPMVAEEDIYLLGPGFATMMHEWVYVLPSYAAWFAATDQTPGYLHFRQVVQTLQWLRGGRKQRWLLKCPQHMEQLGPLRAAFPDAVIVETLRDPATACVSVTNLSTYGQRLRTNTPDPIGTGAAFTHIITRLVEAYVRDRPADHPHFVPIHFGELMKEPMAAVEAVYAAAGLSLSSGVRAAMAAHIAANRAKPGHRGSDYAAEDFGIDVAALRTRLAPYYARFGVAHDPRL